MKYKITKQNKPSLTTFGKYVAKAIHDNTIDTRQILQEVASRNGISLGELTTAMIGLSEVISEHLRQGDRVRLENWGLMKLEIESDKVDSPKEFKPHKHIRGVRLHFLPESSGGSPNLYRNLKFERKKSE